MAVPTQLSPSSMPAMASAHFFRGRSYKSARSLSNPFLWLHQHSCVPCACLPSPKQFIGSLGLGLSRSLPDETTLNRAPRFASPLSSVGAG